MEPTTTAMDGRVCLVTGATSGIGRATAIELARLGAEVILVGLGNDQGESALAEVRAANAAARPWLRVIDLSSMPNVRALVDEVRQRHQALHVLVNNAGIYPLRRQITEEGNELCFATNYLAAFSLTMGLLPVLGSSPGARVINVSSFVHRVGRIDFDDLFHESGYMNFRAYARSKLALVLFAREFACRVPAAEITCNCVHPGVTSTNIGTPGPVGTMMRLGRPVMRSPKRAADTIVYLASSADVEQLTGAYVVDRKICQPGARARDEELARRLWEKSLELTGHEGLGERADRATLPR
jgi:NAD(P)-dependent dehydrogenase (short-subunit alcohol dehydrogenase family)